MTEDIDQGIPRLQALLETVRLLNSTLQLEELTKIILEVVRGQIAVERVSVFVVDWAEKRLRSLVAQELEGEELALPLGVGIAGTVASTGEVLDIPDAYADPRFSRDSDRKLGYYTHDLFAVPVSNREGKVVGVLELLNRSRPITAADREFLLGISVYIGLALENAWLHREFLADKENAEGELAETGTQDPALVALGLLEFLPERGELPADVWAHLEAVRQGFRQAAEATAKFGDFLKLQRDGLTAFDVGEELHRLAELQSETWERNNIRTTLMAETAPPIQAYAYELRLVLSFLIRMAENAILNGDSGRRLRIHSRNTGRNVQISIHYDLHDAVLRLSHGLAAANFVVRRCNGRIRFESKPERGTTIVVELPVVRESIPGAV